MSCAAALSIRRGFAGEAAGAYSSKRNERPGTREQSKESGHDAKIPRHRRNKRRRGRTSKINIPAEKCGARRELVDVTVP